MNLHKVTTYTNYSVASLSFLSKLFFLRATSFHFHFGAYIHGILASLPEVITTLMILQVHGLHLQYLTCAAAPCKAQAEIPREGNEMDRIKTSMRWSWAVNAGSPALGYPVCFLSPYPCFNPLLRPLRTSAAITPGTGDQSMLRNRANNLGPFDLHVMSRLSSPSI